MTLISTVMQTTSHGSDLREKADQRDVPPGGSSGRTFFSGARQTGSGPGPEVNVIALRQPSHHDPNDTNKHHRAPPDRDPQHPGPAPGRRPSCGSGSPVGWLIFR